MKGFFPSSRVQRSQPTVGLIPKCGSCGLYKTCQSPKMKPHGKGARSVLVVGEAPGKNEDEEGVPFIGKAGQYLRHELNRLGFNLQRDAITTNSIICRPINNAKPEPKQLDYCRPNLFATIEAHNPNVIVTLGHSALCSVLPSYWKGDIGSMERWAGWKIPLAQHWICPTYHPSFLLRSHNTLLDRAFADHLQVAFEITEPPPPMKDLVTDIDLLYEEKQIYEAIREIDAQGGWAAVDYETNCLKPEYPKAQIVSCAISNSRHTISFPWYGKARQATSLFLRSDRTRKIASNLKFEERWTVQHLGHPVTNWGWDTMLAAHCLDNRPHICSLKFQAFVQLGVSSYNENIEPYLSGTPYNRISEIDLASLLLYGGTDSLLEYKLAMQQRKEMGYED